MCREDKSGKYLQACEAERQAARKDILAGKLTVEYYEGITIAKRNFEFDKFYRNYLIATMELNGGQPIAWPAGPRFTILRKWMGPFRKYGESFLDTVRDHALEEYKTFNTLDAQRKKKYIDFNYVYFGLINQQRTNQHRTCKTGSKRKIDFNKLDLSGSR